MSKPVPFVDVARLHQPLKAEMLERIACIIDQSSFVLGEDVARFEKNFATFVGTRHGVGVASGLDALKLALQALQVGRGDEVVVPANTFIATALAVSHVGAKPVLVDVDPVTFTLDPAGFERALTSKTKAVIPVHLFGQAADMKPILELAKARNLAVVEDAAQAHGATYAGRQCGSLGTIGCFSFYPTKNLGAMGEGGAITTDDSDLAQRIAALRNVGQLEKNRHVYIGHNSRLHSFQAAVLDVKLAHLKTHNEQRQRTAELYHQYLTGVVQPQVAALRTHVYHLYVVQTASPAERDGLKDHLGKLSISTAVHYPYPIHLQQCYRDLGKGPGSFPVSEKLAATMLSLPMFPGMTEAEVKTVADGIAEFYSTQ